MLKNSTFITKVKFYSGMTLKEKKAYMHKYRLSLSTYYNDIIGFNVSKSFHNKDSW